MTPNQQVESERAVFDLFAEAAGLPIEPGSVEPRKPPEPDIRCTLVDAGPRCFELVEIIDSDLAKAVGVQLKFQERLLNDARVRQLEALSNALVFVDFSRSSTNAQKHQACSALLGILENLPPGVRGDIDPGEYSGLAGLVRKLRITRGDFAGPAFQVDGVTSISDPIVERIREKFAKSYTADAPIDLLAYYLLHPTSRVEYELPGVAEYVQANLGVSPFSIVWVFDADNRKLLYRSQQVVA
jgi:hypothetical protein